MAAPVDARTVLASSASRISRRKPDHLPKRGVVSTPRHCLENNNRSQTKRFEPAWQRRVLACTPAIPQYAPQRVHCSGNHSVRYVGRPHAAVCCSLQIIGSYKESTQLFPIQVDSRDGSAMACVADLNLEDNPGITSGSPILISLQGLLVEFIRAFGELCGVGTARTSRAGSRSPWESEQPTDEPSHRSPLDIAAALREAVLGLPELILLDVLLLPGTIGHLLRPIQECLDRLQSERPGTGQILATEYVAFVVDLCARVSR